MGECWQCGEEGEVACQEESYRRLISLLATGEEGRKGEWEGELGKVASQWDISLAQVLTAQPCLDFIKNVDQ